MRTFLVLAALGWAMSLPWITLFSYLVLIVIAIAVLWFISVAIERRVASNWTGGQTIDRNYVAALEAMVAEAETQMEALRVEVERVRSTAAASVPDPKAALCARVGLSAQAPDWLILAARRAYRVALHPDQHPPHRKQEAEHRFKLAESVFEAIATQRASA